MVDELQRDEHECPTLLNERNPLLPFLFPFDWSDRQVYWMATCGWIAMQSIANATSLQDFLNELVYVLVGAVFVAIEYAFKPSPEFWLSAWFEYLLVLFVSAPSWIKRLLPRRVWIAWVVTLPYHLVAWSVCLTTRLAIAPFASILDLVGVDLPIGLRHAHHRVPHSPPGDNMNWPLATVPMWLGKQLVQDVEILPDGVARLPQGPGRPVKFGVAVGIRPVPHPDLQPLLMRQVMIQARLGIFTRIRGQWSLHLQVRPFDPRTLEIAAGPAWDWVRTEMLPRMVSRRPSLVLYGTKAFEMVEQADAIALRFYQASMTAWRRGPAEMRKIAAELWADTGQSSTGRVRIGVRRVIAGLHGYRSWAVILLPRIIHLAWLRPLTSESLLCDLAFHVRSRRVGPARRSLQRKVRRWRAVDQDDDYAGAVEDAKHLIGEMRRGRDTEVEVGLYVTARAEQAPQVAEALETAQCEFREANVMQHRALRATRTLGGDPYRRTMRSDLRSVACTDVLATAGYFPDGGTLVGEGLGAPEPVALNLLDQDELRGNINWSMFVAMMMGGGKTTTAELIAWRMANPHPQHVLYGSGLQVVSIDFKPTGDYAQLYRHLARVGQRAAYNSWATGALPPIEGHMGFNLSDVPEKDRGARLLELTQRLEEWAAAHPHGDRPMLLLMDEILALLEVEGGPAFIKRFGTQSRGSNIAVIYMSQEVKRVLDNAQAGIAFSNCSHVLVGRHSPAGINALTPVLSLEEEAQVLLAGAPQGAGLLRIERKDGSIMLGVQVRPTDWEKREFGTNPTERAARWRAELMHNSMNGKEERNGHALVGHALLGGGLRRPGAVQASADPDRGFPSGVATEPLSL